ncbi:MAG: hypothetical protein RBS91_09470 [Sulfurimonadaceae bacterium]|jgi:hypothetical protein|nr:hypothetical protein [Sulfurimonadaceae bacterium]
MKKVLLELKVPKKLKEKGIIVFDNETQALKVEPISNITIKNYNLILALQKEIKELEERLVDLGEIINDMLLVDLPIGDDE